MKYYFLSMSELANRGFINKRYDLLDLIRGITLLSMIAYHICWDLVFLFHLKGAFADFLVSDIGNLWQQSICWTFILLSGFCIPLSHHPIKRGIVVSLAGAVVTVVTLFFMPENIVVFGILSFLGSAMILVGLLYRYLIKVPAWAGLAVCSVLFYITRHVNDRHLHLFITSNMPIPEAFYANHLSSYFGFPHPQFSSTDYFSLIPWIFLFLAGMYLYLLLKKYGVLNAKAMQIRNRFLCFIGKHSLLIYLLHQPIGYALLLLLEKAGLL